MSGLIKAEPLDGRLRQVRCKGGIVVFTPLRLYKYIISAEKRKCKWGEL